jgi:uncharacterized protein DUF4365
LFWNKLAKGSHCNHTHYYETEVNQGELSWLSYNLTGDAMAINSNRRTERVAVNALRALLERHHHIVQEIDGGNDYGEDLYVSFTENGERTGDTVAIQVKGGRSYKTKTGYRIPIQKHSEAWRKSSLVVLGVVQDADTGGLFWANISEQVRRAKRDGKELSSIRVARTSLLSDATILLFSQRVQRFLAEFGDLHRFLAKISGGEFDSIDYLAYFVNEHGEQMIFQQKRGHDTALLLHRDLDWRPQSIKPQDLKIGDLVQGDESPEELAMYKSVPTVGNIILDMTEAMWLMACFSASKWVRKAPKLV